MLGTLLSTLVVGYGMWLALPLTGIELPLIYCLIFGAVISPTDAIAVLLFSLLMGMLASGLTPTLGDGIGLLLHEVGGGLLLGLALGYVTFRLLKSADGYQVAVLLSLAAVTGGYALASRLGVSGPLAMVVAGLIIGNHGRALAMSELTRRYLDMFWGLIDESLNAMLFVLIGMEVVLVLLSASLLVAAGVAISVTLLARLLTAGLPVAVLRRAFNLPRGAWKLLTWGGLRGGVSVALALSLPASPERDIVVALTCCVVVSFILVQGFSIGPLARRAVVHR